MNLFRIPLSWKSEIASFTKELIRIPSVCGINPEVEMARALAKKAAAFGIKASLVAKEKQRPNLVIDLLPDKKPAFLLLGHMDTVGVQAKDRWRFPPFAGIEKNEKIFGRGAIDMKAGLACILFALRAFRVMRYKKANIRAIFVSNEEGGIGAEPVFSLGMEYLIRHGYVKGAAAIYGYGGKLHLGIGHRGVLRIRVMVEGEAVHTGSLKWQKKEKGANAVTGAAEFLLAVEKMKLLFRPHPAFPGYEPVITPGVFIHHGGTAVSTVPDICESAIDIRLLPGQDLDAVFGKIQRIAKDVEQRRQGINIALTPFVKIPPVAIVREEKVVRMVSQEARQVFGKTPLVKGTGPANESFLLIQKGIPTITFGPVGEGAHAPNEWVSVASLSKIVQVYQRAIVQFFS